MSTCAYPSKGADGHTLAAQTAGSKQVKVVHYRAGMAVDIHKAPPSRLYTRDYAKVPPSPEDVDLVSPVLGNPLRW